MFDGAFSPVHLLIFLFVVFLFFGAKRLPDLGKGLGSGIREFKKGLDELHSDIDGDAASAVVTPVTDGSSAAVEVSPAAAGVEPTQAPAE